LLFDVRARSFGDPPPIARAGRLDGLWTFEVVELFLLGTDDHYLEIELGPHGHWLALALHGTRTVVDATIPLEVRWAPHPMGWQALGILSRASLPRGLARVNAYAIHGQGQRRRYLAWTPVPGTGPDFHRLDSFGSLDPALIASLR